MSATSATVAGRAAAEALMLDACTVTDAAAVQVYDSATDSYLTPAGALRYSGPCRVKPRTDSSDRAVEVGGASVSLWPYLVSTPMSAVDIGLDDVVTITASALDPALIGLRLIVRQVAMGTNLTARRLGCEVQS